MSAGYQPGGEESLTATVAGLRARGFDDDFELVDGGLRCGSCGQLVGLEDLVVVEVHRFEGESNPDDEAIVVALECQRCGWRGTLVGGYGLSASEGEARFLAAMTSRGGGTGSGPTRPRSSP